MPVKFDLFSILNIIGLSYSIFLAITLILKRSGNRKANFLLALFIITCVLCTIFVILFNTNLFYYLPHLIYLDHVFIFLLGPLVYFYVKALTQPSSIKFNKIDLIHLIPFVIISVYMFPDFIKSGDQKILETILFLKNGTNQFIIYILPLALVQIVFYLINVLILIKRHEVKIKQTFSSIEKINLSWIKHFILVFGIVAFVFTPIFFLLPLGFSFRDVANLFPISVFLAIFLIGYNAWIQPEIFFENNKKKSKAEEKSYAEEANEEESLLKLLDFFARKKPFLDPKLSLLDLSKQLNISLVDLTTILNKYLNKNFYDFINGYRIDEAKKMLVDSIGSDPGSHLSIYSKAGFDSKAAFSKTFKNYTNMTPLQYRLKYLLPKTKGSCFTIGVFIDSFYDNYESIIFSGIQKLSAENGIRLITFSGGAINAPQYSQTKKNSVFDLADSESIDGIIMISSCLGSYITIEELTRFYNLFHDIPIVSIGTELKGYPSVIVDNYSGIQDLLTHLIEFHGYKKIAFIRGPVHNIEAESRFKAYKDTLDKFKIPLDENLIVPGDFFGDTGKKAVSLLKDERNVVFDAIVASNDLVALQIIQELDYRGIKVPEETAVVGFDNIKEGRYLAKPLTTVSQPLFDLGYQAIKAILAVLYGQKYKDKLELPSKLVVRRTCGCTNAFYGEGNFVNIINNSDGYNNDPDKFKAHLIPEVENLLYEQFSSIIDEKLRSEWATLLVESLIEDIIKLREDKFLIVLEDIVSEAITNRNDSDLWNDVILYIINNVLSILTVEKRIRFINEIKIKAKSIIDNTGLILIGYPIMKTKDKEFDFYIITQSLSTYFEIEKLAEIIMQNFPKLGIKSCYICLFEGNDRNETTQYSKAVVAYKDYKKLEYNENESVFLTSNLIPGGIKDLTNDNPYIIMSLNFYKELLGYVLYEIDNADREVFEILTIQISNALKGVIQYDHMKKQVEALKIHSKNEVVLADKYQKSRLPKDLTEAYFKKLLDYIEKEEVFKEPDLTLPELSDELNIPRNHLSYVINEYAGLNFYDFINTYRVEEAKKLLLKADQDNINILNIAFDSGFKSKSTFNKVFKKHTSKTPTEFRKDNAAGAKDGNYH